MIKKVLFCLFFLSHFAYSAHLDPDFKQPVLLSGDFLKVNLNSKNGIYKGNFVATQGSMKLEGTEINLQQKQNNELDMIIALGKPVKFQKKNHQTGELIQGRAQKITYDANKLLVILEGNAEIKSDFGKSLKGSLITYGLTTGEIEAKGDGQQRVQIMIAPNQSKQSSPLR